MTPATDTQSQLAALAAACEQLLSFVDASALQTVDQTLPLDHLPPALLALVASLRSAVAQSKSSISDDQKYIAQLQQENEMLYEMLSTSRVASLHAQIEMYQQREQAYESLLSDYKLVAKSLEEECQVYSQAAQSSTPQRHHQDREKKPDRASRSKGDGHGQDGAVSSSRSTSAREEPAKQDGRSDRQRHRSRSPDRRSAYDDDERRKERRRSTRPVRHRSRSKSPLPDSKDERLSSDPRPLSSYELLHGRSAPDGPMSPPQQPAKLPRPSKRPPQSLFARAQSDLLPKPQEGKPQRNGAEAADDSKPRDSGREDRHRRPQEGSSHNHHDRGRSSGDRKRSKEDRHRERERHVRRS